MLTSEGEVGLAYKRFCDLCGAEMPVGKLPITGHSNMPEAPGRWALKTDKHNLTLAVYVLERDSHIDACNGCMLQLLELAVSADNQRKYGVV